MGLFSLALVLASFTLTVRSDSIFERSFRILHREPPPPAIISRLGVETKWIEQKLDQFNMSDGRTWKMRYMSNENHFQSGGPIFIFVGGEWQISPGYLQGGHMFDMARKLNGSMYYTEHRYYGKSFPTEDITSENLRFLSVDQALADLAHFIKTIKMTSPGKENSKVILVGGSYSASMVIWFQRIYPDLAAGAWASSAPLLAKVDFTEYKEVVGESINLLGGKQCYSRIENGIKELEKMTTNAKHEIRQLLNLCDSFDFSNKLNVWTLFAEISDLFAGLVQGHNAGDIENACKTILSAEDDVTGVISWVKKFLNSKNCTDISYEAFTRSLSNTSNTATSMMRQWFYQTCSEFGWYQTSGSNNQPFGTKFPVELYISACRDGYGERFSSETIQENIVRTNSVYGGMNPEAKNIVLTHGQLDPWRAMGLQEQEEESNVVPLYAHCKDFTSISDKDTKEMRKSKEKVQKLIFQWLEVDNIINSRK